MRLIAAALLGWLAVGSPVRFSPALPPQDPPATERIPIGDTAPNGSFPNAFPRWLAPTLVDAVFSIPPVGNPNVVPVLTDPSVAVDSRNIAHVVGVRIVPGVPGSAVCYYTNRFETRQTNGFSMNYPLAVSAGGATPTDPDISIGPDDEITVVWIYNTTVQVTQNESRPLSNIVVQRKTSSGWQPPTFLTNDSASLQVTYVYAMPQVHALAGGDYRVVAARRQFNYQQVGGGGWGVESMSTDIRYISPPPNGSVEVIASNPAYLLDTLRFDVHTNGDAWVVWQEYVNQVDCQVRYSHRNGGAWPTMLLAAAPSFGADVQLNSQGLPHFAWIDNTGVRARFNMDASQLVNTVGGAFARTRVAVDSRDQVHVMWGSLSYAARVRNPAPDSLSLAWAPQEPFVAPGPDIATQVAEVAVTANDQIHAVTAGAEMQEAHYTRTMEYDLGGRDPLGMIPAAPGFAINATNGNLTGNITFFNSFGAGPSASVGLIHNSMEPYSGLVSQGWKLNYEAFLVDHWRGINNPAISFPDVGESVTLFLPSGRAVHFYYYSYIEGTAQQCYLIADDEYGYFDKLQRLTVASLVTGFILTSKHGDVWTFSNTGKLEKIEDPSGNTLEITYASGRMQTISDMKGNGGVGRTTTLTYEQNNNALYGSRLTQVTDPEDKTYNLAYVNNLLGTVTVGAQNSTWTFDSYTANNLQNKARVNLIHTVKTPGGTAGGFEWTLRYLQDNRIAEVEDPATSIMGESGGVGSDSPILYVDYLESANPQAPRVTRITNRRGFESEATVEYRRSLVIEFADPVALAAVSGIVATRNVYATPRPLLQNHRNRMGVITYFDYDPPETNPAARHVADNLRGVIKGGVRVEHYTYHPTIYNSLRTVHRAPITMSGPVPVSPADVYCAYDMDGRLESETYPDVTRLDGQLQNNVQKSFTHGGSRGQLTRITDERGYFTDFSNFDPDCGLPQSAQRSGGSQTEEFRYSKLGLKTRHRLPQGSMDNELAGWSETEYDDRQRVSHTTDPKGMSTYIGYNPDSCVTAQDLPAGTDVTTEYDHRGFATTGTSADGTWHQWVDANGNVRKRTDERGFITLITYDAMDRPLVVSRPGGSSLLSGGGGGPAVVTEYEHDAVENGQLCSKETIQGSPNLTTITFYDSRGRVSSVLQPDGLTRLTTVYDDRDQVRGTELRYNNALQTCTEQIRDARQRVQAIQVQNTPIDVPAANFSTTFYLLNRTGAVERVVDPLGTPMGAGFSHRVTYVRDARDRVAQVIDGMGVIVEQRVYGDDDLVNEVWAPNPETKSTTLILKSKTAYTCRKEVLWTEDGGGNRTTAEYGTYQGQVDHVTDPGSVICKSFYDANSQRKTRTVRAFESSIGENSDTYFDHDEHGIPVGTRVHNPQSGQYDATHGQAVDPMGRVEKITPPIGAAEVRTFDSYSLPLQVTNGSREVELAHNMLGLVTEMVYTGSEYKVVACGYDGAGNRTFIQDGTYRCEMSYISWSGTPNAEAFLVWDPVTEQYVIWKMQAHYYDAAKNYVAFLDAEGELHGWGYDGNNRVQAVTYDNKIVSQNAYTPGGLPDFTIIRDADENEIARTTYFYDSLGRRVRALTERTVVNPPTTLSDLRWVYNSRNQVVQIGVFHQGELSWMVAYDERGNLTSESTLGNEGSNASLEIGEVSYAYAYDKADNRITRGQNGVPVSSLTYDDASRLVSESASGWSTSNMYDGWGNLISKTTTEGSTETVETFGYNYMNRLSSYTKEVGSTTVASWQYEYWPTGDRHSKRNLGSSESVEDDMTWLFVCRHADVSIVFTQSGDDEPEMSQRYVQGVGIDSKSVRIAADGTRRHFLSDLVGTVEMTLDDDGTVEEECLRDVWGNTLAGDTNDERFGFAQREHDTESGLVYMRHRMYDPRIGRFTQLDPLLRNRPFEHYRYAANNPVNNHDPMGLDPCKTCGREGCSGRSCGPPIQRQDPDGNEYTCYCDRNLLGGAFEWLGLPPNWGRNLAMPCMCNTSKEDRDKFGILWGGKLADSCFEVSKLSNVGFASAVFVEQWSSGKSVSINPRDMSKGEALLDLGIDLASYAVFGTLGEALEYVKGMADIRLTSAGKLEVGNESSQILMVDFDAARGNGKVVSRSFGGENAEPFGRSWTPELRSNQSRNALGLESRSAQGLEVLNTAEYQVFGKIINPAATKEVIAAPWGRFSGGAREMVISQAKDNVRVFMVLKPRKPLAWNKTTDPRPYVEETINLDFFRK